MGTPSTVWYQPFVGVVSTTHRVVSTIYGLISIVYRFCSTHRPFVINRPPFHIDRQPFHINHRPFGIVVVTDDGIHLVAASRHMQAHAELEKGSLGPFELHYVGD